MERGAEEKVRAVGYRKPIRVNERMKDLDVCIANDIGNPREQYQVFRSEAEGWKKVGCGIELGGENGCIAR